MCYNELAMPSQEKCRILDHQQLGPRYFKLTLLSKYIATHAQPGQFVQVKCADSFDPLLRRPLILHKINAEHETFDLLYEVVGRGIELLTKYFVGEELDILGPLGEGYKIDPVKKVHILVAGGLGIAPLRALADKVKSQNSKVKSNELYILMGAKNKGAVHCETAFKEIADQVVV